MSSALQGYACVSCCFMISTLSFYKLPLVQTPPVIFLYCSALIHVGIFRLLSALCIWGLPAASLAASPMQGHKETLYLQLSGHGQAQYGQHFVFWRYTFLKSIKTKQLRALNASARSASPTQCFQLQCLAAPLKGILLFSHQSGIYLSTRVRKIWSSAQ